MTYQLLFWVLIFGAFVELLDMIFPASPPDWWGKNAGPSETPRPVSEAGNHGTGHDHRLPASKKE